MLHQQHSSLPTGSDAFTLYLAVLIASAPCLRKMAPKRSWLRLNRTRSFSFVEILLETLVVLVVVTELSVECGKAFFPGWRMTRVEPTARLHYSELLTGVSQDKLFVPHKPIDESTRSNLTGSRMGSMILLSATGALYVIFAAFLFANQNWKPPVISLADKSTARQCRLITCIIWSATYLCGHFTIRLVHSMGPWEGQVFMSQWVLFLLWIWLALVFGCGRACGIPPESIDNDNENDKTNKSVQNTADEHIDSAVIRSSMKVLAWVFTVLFMILSLCLGGVVLLVMALLFGLSPLISTFIAVGVLRCAIAIFGEAAVIPGLLVVSCLLILHCAGRLMGIWFTDGSVTWIVTKLRKLRSIKKNAEKSEDFPSKTTSVKLDNRSMADQEKVNVNSPTHLTSVVKFLLDGMAICVISSALWHIYISGTTYDPADADPWFIITTGKLPQCFMTTMASLVETPMDDNHTCSFLNHPFSPIENKAMDASFVISGLTLLSMLPCILALIAVGCLLIVRKVIAGSLACCGITGSTWTSSAETKPSTDFYNLHCNLGAFPLYFVKVILPFYTLDLLPENWYIPGITAYLVGYALYFYWKLMIGLTAALKKVIKFCVEGSVKKPCNEKAQLIWKELHAEIVLDMATASRKSGTYNDSLADATSTTLLLTV